MPWDSDAGGFAPIASRYGQRPCDFFDADLTPEQRYVFDLLTLQAGADAERRAAKRGQPNQMRQMMLGRGR